MQFLIVLIMACAIFAVCFAVFLLKARREGGPPRLHRCGEGRDCHCYGQATPQEPFNLVDLLEKASQAQDGTCPKHRTGIH